MTSPLSWLRSLLDNTEFTLVPIHELSESERPPALPVQEPVFPLSRKVKRCAE